MSIPDSLHAAFEGRAWGVSSLLFSLHDLHDDENRPLGERRAASAAKDGVSIELIACPYRDPRNGRPMNVSALEQVMRHLPAVLADIRAFRAPTRTSGAGWLSLLVTVTDQLLGPARYLLQERLIRPIPARLSVGHKLAAGYFDVLRRLVRRELEGAAPTASVAELVAFVGQEGALLGASECCAGPLNMIEKVSASLLDPVEHADCAVESARHLLSRSLTMQVALGVAWQIFDEHAEARFLGHGSDELVPRTSLIKRAIEQSRSEISTPLRGDPDLVWMSVARGFDMAPQSLFGDTAKGCSAMGGSRHLEDGLVDIIELDNGALRHASTSAARAFVQETARYLAAYRCFVATQRRLEFAMREALGYPAQAPIALDGLVRPASRQLRWIEAILGHTLELHCDAPCQFVFRNVHRRARLDCNQCQGKETRA